MMAACRFEHDHLPLVSCSNINFEMMTEEHSRTLELPKTNGAVEDAPHEHDDETATDTSSAPQVRRSRFFRSKRKQRLNDEQSHPDEANDGDASSEPTDSPENPQQSPEDNSTTTTTDSPAAHTIRKRLSSPPPPPPAADESSELDTSSNSDEIKLASPAEDIDAERQAYLAKKRDHELQSFAQPRPSLPTIYSGYQRKKSQSVKLTRIDPLDSYPKKNVRFADDFGLDLSQVKVIKSDELPHVPSAAFKDLHVGDENSTNAYQERMKTITYLEQQFENPIHGHGFDDRVARHKVVLEQANAIDNRIYGTIKIISYGLNKRVKIRLTMDNWVTFIDHDATYIVDSFDGTHDRFTFTLDVDRGRICLGNNVQFCIVYESYAGPEYWDNNYQQNYRFDCISRSIPDYSG